MFRILENCKVNAPELKSCRKLNKWSKASKYCIPPSF